MYRSSTVKFSWFALALFKTNPFFKVKPRVSGKKNMYPRICHFWLIHIVMVICSCPTIKEYNLRGYETKPRIFINMYMLLFYISYSHPQSFILTSKHL